MPSENKGESGITAQSKSILFQPKGRKDLRELYDDLRNDSAFEPLSSNEMFFVWAYSCQGSPYYTISDYSERVHKSFRFAYENEDSNAKEYNARLDAYLNKQFPSTFAAAIKRMKEFSNSLRSRAHRMLEDTFDSYDSILKEGRELLLNKSEDGMIDVDAAKKFVDLTANIRKELPELLKLLESGTGITVVQKEKVSAKSGNATTLAEKILDRNAKQ